MTATVSSIHINGWYGDHNKLDGARWIVRTLLGRALDAEFFVWVQVRHHVLRHRNGSAT